MRSAPSLDIPLSVAPMMARTDRHFRYLMRRITRGSLLYTEMVHARAVLQGHRDRLLAFHPDERPLALQIGTDDPAEAAEAARVARDWGFDAINLNVGCPSDRVQAARFGACLMAEPERVRRIVEAMASAAEIPVTVKHRIGIDDRDAYADLLDFVDRVAASGACDRFSVHARKAWLSGLSPKENRRVPPLRHSLVHRLKRERPELRIEINGGIRDLEAAQRHLRRVDAVMIGRAAYDAPMLFAPADARILGLEADAAGRPSRRQVVEAMLPYLEAERAAGTPLQQVTRHMMGLFAGRPGASAWRRHLAARQHRPEAGPELLVDAMRQLPEAALV